MMSVGKGAAHSTSTRQKLSTKSSTEAELVAVDDVMPQALWARNFLTEQGCKVTDNVVLQDNKSAMLLENNGKRSSGKRARHIDVRYFFVTDRIASDEARVEHCPTDDMIADFLTKPLQGKKFRQFRDLILNIDAGYDYDPGKLDDADPEPHDQHHRSVLDTVARHARKTVRWADIVSGKVTRGCSENRKQAEATMAVAAAAH